MAGHNDATDRRLLHGTRVVLVAFLLLVAVQDALRDDVSFVEHWVSHLSLGPWGWVQVVSFVLTGLAIVGLGLSLRRAGAVRSRGARWIVVAGTAFALAGVFVSDAPPGTAYDEIVTWHGTVHDLAGGTFFVALTGSCLRTAPRVSRLWGRLAAAGIAGFWVLASVLAGIGYADPARHLPSGLAERAAVLCGFLWLLVLATRRIRDLGPATPNR
jgi:hypothetical membrane protein